MQYKEQIDLSRIPQHVAIIMDGNGRWAKQRGHERSYGHQVGAETVHVIAEEAARLGIRYLTLYTFSTENWNRPSDEVAALMGLLFDSIEEDTFMKNNISFRIIGDIEKLPANVQDRLYSCVENTSKNTGMCLVLALSYSSRWETSDDQLHARSRFADTHRRRNPSEQLPALAMRIFGTLFLRNLLARFPGRGTLQSHLRLPETGT